MKNTGKLSASWKICVLVSKPGWSREWGNGKAGNVKGSRRSRRVSCRSETVTDIASDSCLSSVAVLSQYEMVVAQIPKRLHEVSTGVKVAVEAYKPEAE
jgi:hypothetical protein